MTDTTDTEERSKTGWFFYHMWQGISSFYMKRPLLWSLVLLGLIGYAAHMRWVFQPYVLEGRKYAAAALVVIAIMWLARRFLRNKGPILRKFVTVVIGAVAVAGVIFGYPVNQYITSYLAYQNLNIVNLNELPLTANERGLPLNAVATLARERIGESNVQITSPDLIHTPEGDMWTLALEPNRAVGQISGVVDEVIQVPATDISPDFSRGDPIRVSFPTGENMRFSDNIHTCVLRAFGPWRYLNYEVGNVLYMPDNTGEWVQVVSLIKWTGLFFPKPEFGGVQIIRQDTVDSTKNHTERMLTGCGEFIPAHRVEDVPFLRDQNLVAPKVMRFIAESFRFRAGFFAPTPLYNEDTVGIPELPSDMNPQPFNLHFVMPGEEEGSLYSYFGLEPSTDGNIALAISLFIPADNPDTVYQFVHSEHGGSPIGVSAVEAKVRGSRPMVDWSANRAVESRPYIRRCQTTNGLATKFFWMTSVVTNTDEESTEGVSDFTVSGIIQNGFTDANGANNVIWPEDPSPEGWAAALDCE